MEQQNWNKFDLDKLEVIASIIEVISEQKVNLIETNNYMEPKEPKIKNGIQNVGVAQFQDGNRVLYNVVFTNKDTSSDRIEISNRMLTMMAHDLYSNDEIDILPAYSIIITTGKIDGYWGEDGWLHYGYADEDEEVIVDASIINLNKAIKYSQQKNSRIDSWCDTYGKKIESMLNDKTSEIEIDEELDEYESGRADMLSDVLMMMTDLGVDPDLITLVSGIDAETKLC